jgi:hypothetical protein
MEQAAKYLLNIESLNKCIQEAESIVIYGAGDFGKCLIDYMISIKEENKIIGIVVTKKSTDCEYKGIEIHEAVSFLPECGDCYVLIAASFIYKQDMAEVVNCYNKRYRYISDELYMDMTVEMDERTLVSYSGVDFLCVGFFKCGTTSLYSALKPIDSVYLSVVKETGFFQWCDAVKNAKEMLIDKVFNKIREGQIVGMIEPSFAYTARKVYDFFGDKVKIFFLVRNPVNAAFSGFKMNNREGMAGMEAAYQREGGRFDIGIFDEWFERGIHEETLLDWEYAHWIEQFSELYPKEQMKIVIFEELIQNPQVIVNDILKFIGASGKYEFEKLPLANEGDFVMADIEGYKLGKTLHDWYSAEYALSMEEIRNRRYENYSECTKLKEKYKKAEKIYGVKMTAEQRRKVEKYYDGSVRKLESFISRDLSDLWF